VFRVGPLFKTFQYVADSCDPGVGILRPRFWRIDEGRIIKARDRLFECRLRRFEIVAHGRFANESRAMRHELSECYLPSKRIAWLKVWQIPRNRRIQVQLALFNELHDRDVGKELRYRADPVHGLRGGWYLFY